MLPKVRSWVLANQGSHADAEDVFQEALEIVLLKIESVDKSLSGLILQLAKRRWIDRLRKTKGLSAVDHESVQQIAGPFRADYIEEKQQQYIRHKMMESAFNRLSDTCRKLLEKVKEGLPVETITRQMNFNSANTLYRRKAACTRRWSEMVKEDAQYKLYFA